MQIDSRRKTNPNSICKYHDAIITVTSSMLKYDQCKSIGDFNLTYNLIFLKKVGKKLNAFQ